MHRVFALAWSLGTLPSSSGAHKAGKLRFDTFAFEPVSLSPEEISRNTDAKWKIYEQLVKKANISLD